MSDLANMTLAEMQERNLPPFLILAELERRGREPKPAPQLTLWQRMRAWWAI